MRSHNLESNFWLLSSALTVGTGVVCGTHAGFTIQGVNLQAGVLAEAVLSVVIEHVVGLDAGVTFEGVGRFGDGFGTPDILQAAEGVAVTQLLPDLGDLMEVVGCEDEGVLHSSKTMGANAGATPVEVARLMILNVAKKMGKHTSRSTSYPCCISALGELRRS